MIDLETVKLLHGGHKSRDEGVCLMEAVAWFAGEPHSFRPRCACPVIGAVAVRLNDRFDDESRQALKRFIPRIVGTKGDRALERRRMFAAADFAVRRALVLALEKRGFADLAARATAIAEIVDAATARKARDEARSIREMCWKKWTSFADVADVAAVVAAVAVADVVAGPRWSETWNRVFNDKRREYRAQLGSELLERLIAITSEKAAS